MRRSCGVARRGYGRRGARGPDRAERRSKYCRAVAGRLYLGIMAASIRLVVLGLAAALATGCDRTPTAPELDDVAGLLVRSHPAAANSRIYNNTLPALFRESIEKVRTQQGREGVDVLLSEWRGLQDKLKAEAPAASRTAVQARLAAIHDAELRIVRRVLGNPAISRVISETRIALDDAALQMTAATLNGEDMESARSVAAEASAKLEAARVALAKSDSREALETATHAATLVAGLRYYLIEARRIHGLETLLPEAIAQLNAKATAAAEPVRNLENINARVRAALDAGNRAQSHKLLAEARAAQISLVLRAFGPERVALMLRQVDARAKELGTRVDDVRNAGRDVIKLQRMLHEAQDMNARAQNALRSGDAATALDLGSHAAGLLNAAQHLTWQ